MEMHTDIFTYEKATTISHAECKPDTNCISAAFSVPTYSAPETQSRTPSDTPSWALSKCWAVMGGAG
jgi:hypothetical protein